MWCQIVEDQAIPPRSVSTRPFSGVIQVCTQAQRKFNIPQGQVSRISGHFWSDGDEHWIWQVHINQRKASSRWRSEQWRGALLLFKDQGLAGKPHPSPHYHWCVQGILTSPQPARRTAQNKHIIGSAHLQSTPNTLLQVHLHLFPLT